jgi:hypothetical protein
MRKWNTLCNYPLYPVTQYLWDSRALNRQNKLRHCLLKSGHSCLLAAIFIRNVPCAVFSLNYLRRGTTWWILPFTRHVPYDQFKQRFEVRCTSLDRRYMPATIKGSVSFQQLKRHLVIVWTLGCAIFHARVVSAFFLSL